MFLLPLVITEGRPADENFTTPADALFQFAARWLDRTHSTNGRFHSILRVTISMKAWRYCIPETMQTGGSDKTKEI
jgi:hypothetical protein